MTIGFRMFRDDVLVALHPESTEGQLAELVNSKSVEVRVALAERPYALATLVGDKDVRVLVAVASGQETPPELLAKLALHPEVEVRKAVHKNKSATEEIRVQAALLGV